MSLFIGYGYDPIIVEGDDPGLVHPAFSRALNECADKIAAIKAEANKLDSQAVTRPTWPMIILRTPKGWTGPEVIDGLQVCGTHRSHQVPMSAPAENPSHLAHLEEWLRSYEPDTLFDENGTLLPELKALVPPKRLRMGNNPYTNPHVTPLILPDFAEFGIPDPKRGQVFGSDMTQLGLFFKKVLQLNAKYRNFRIFGPDETKSNKLGAVFDVTTKQFLGEAHEGDVNLSPDGRVLEMLSEHQCEGWLEGYLLTGGHGVLSSYEAFIHIITSMFNQHAKWMKMCKEISWRNKLPSLNILLSSHVWRQDHNGFTYQDPGFLGHVISKKPDIIRIYLPPDANCLLSVGHHCLKTEHKINVVVAGKHPAPQWLTIEEAREHCAVGVGIWHWASNDKGFEPDIVIACAGDVPTLESLAATSILRKNLPNLKVRFVNVVNLMKMVPTSDHPHGLPESEFDSLFTKDKPVLFAFHGVPHLVKKLVYGRKNRQFDVVGYNEEGTISTAFDMTVMNELDRFHLVIKVCEKVENICKNVDEETKWKAAYLIQEMKLKLVKHKQYIQEFGVDMDEISKWRWDI
jgi:xylulose-5-phosphate/fructose-6-phosphate phosphoketolase